MIIMDLAEGLLKDEMHTEYRQPTQQATSKS